MSTEEKKKDWIQMSYDERVAYIFNSIDVLNTIKGSGDDTNTKLKLIVDVMSNINPKCASIIDFTQPQSVDEYKARVEALAKMGVNMTNQKVSITLSDLSTLFNTHKVVNETDRKTLMMIEDIKYFVQSDTVTNWYKQNVSLFCNEIQAFRNDLTVSLSANSFEIWKTLQTTQ